MDFRRGGSDERRRRVLMDEVAAKERDEESGAEAKPTRKATVRLYSDGAVADRQPRVTDLVPTRWLSLTLLSAFLILAPAALMALGHQMHARGYVQNAPALAALDLTQRGNVAEWFTSLMLAGGSLLALAIFSIRRHRTDDYQGQYRLWLLVAVACLAASLDAATHIREVFGLVVSRLSGQVILGRSAGWCLLGYGLFAGGLTLRVAFEIYRSKAASFMLTLTVLIYGTLAATMVGIAFSEDPLTALVIRTSLILAGASSLVLTLVSYARFVHREAQGITAAKRKKPKVEDTKKKAKPDDDKSSDDSKSDAKPATSAKPGPLAGKGPIKPAVQDDDDEDDEDEDEDRGGTGSRLSKSERKRLKRLQAQPQPTRRAA